MSCPPPMPCKEVIANLWELIDGELAPEPTARMRAHLTTCAPCRAQYELRTAYVRRLSGQRSPAASPELRRRIIQQIRNAEKDSSSDE